MRIILLSMLLFCFVSLYAQQRKNPDSLLKVLPNTSGKEKVRILQDLTIAWLGIDKDKTMLYAEDALKEAEVINNDSLIIAALTFLSAAKENYGDYSACLPLSERAAQLARKTGDKKQLITAIGHLAINYFQTFQVDKTLAVAVEGLELAKELKDTVGMTNMYEMHAQTYQRLKNYDLAEKYFQEEIELIKKTNRQFELGRVYINMGVNYALAKKYQEAIESYEKGIIPFTKINYIAGVAIAHINLGDEYLRLGNYEKSRENYQNALELNKAVKNPSIQGNVKAGLGRLELENGNYDTARAYLLEAEQLGMSMNDQELLKGVYNYLEGYSMAAHDYKNARIYHDKYTGSSDSLLRQEVAQKVTEFQVKYETAQKDKELSEKKSQLFRQRTWLIGLIAGFMLLAILAYLFYNRYRLKQKQILNEALIHEQQLGLNAVIEAQETERKRIAKDLHDGIAQELVALKLGFEQFRDNEHSEKYNSLMSSLDEACTEVRNISHVMSPPILENRGLPGSLEMLLRNSLGLAGIQHQFENLGVNERMDEKIELGIYRIAQELINNIIKHAKANKVIVQLQKMGINLILRIEDNGESFDFDAAKYKGSMGLLNILSRVRTLQGTFASEPGFPKGTISMVRVPIKS